MKGYNERASLPSPMATQALVENFSSPNCRTVHGQTVKPSRVPPGPQHGIIRSDLSAS